jgi:hypothetical protein
MADSAGQIWIGLAQVVPMKGCRRFGNCKGAFVNIVAWAGSMDDFCRRVDNAVTDLDLKLLELEDCEPFARRIKHYGVADEILQMVDTAQENRAATVFGTFHMWKKSD